MSESKQNIFRSSPQALARMMEMEAESPLEWPPEELHSILQHQLSTPVIFDLEGVDPLLAKKSSAKGMRGQLSRSFRDVFQAQEVGLELLVLSKDFAKASLAHPDSLIPRAVAEVLYFASIAAALVRRGKRISQLDDPTLRSCFQRIMTEPWLDEDTRALMRTGLQQLDRVEPTGIPEKQPSS